MKNTFLHFLNGTISLSLQYFQDKALILVELV